MSTKFKFMQFLIALLIPILACSFSDFGSPPLTSTPIAQILATQPIIIPAPTITPAPIPGERISKGDAAYFNGDWDRAIYEYTYAYENNIDNEYLIAALLGLGKTYFQIGDYDKSLTTLLSSQSLSNNSPLQAPIYFALAQAYEALELDQETIDYYLKYSQLRPGLLDHYIYKKIADINFSNKKFQSAINFYLLAIQAPSIENNLLLNIKIGDSYEALGDIATSLITYQDIYNRTTNENIKSQMLYYIGYAQIILGDTASGIASHQLAVDNYPNANFTIYSLTELLNNDIAVNLYTQGYIYYQANQFEAASTAFYYYLDSEINHNDNAHFYYALSLQNSSQLESAISQYDHILIDHIEGDHAGEAVDEKAYLLWYYFDDYEFAIETLQNFAINNPDHPKNPELLYYAGRIAERSNDLERAYTIWKNLGFTYSFSSYAFDGLFQAGIAKYRLEDYTDAVNMFTSSLAMVNDPEGKAKAYFWIGKAHQANENYSDAQTAWAQAVSSDPTGYYSERSSEIMNGLLAFQPEPLINLDINLEAEREEAETWLKLAFDLPQDTQFNDLSTIMSDLRFARGTEFWDLGLFNQSRIEFESLRSAFSNDPLNSYRLSKYLIDLGLYRPGIFAARNVLDLAGFDNAGTFNAPIYFNHLRFGLYFSDLVIPAAESNNIDPLLLFSVMRQESLFEGFVTSSAGARGLMQIMPATGDYKYFLSGWPLDYTSQDLYRPLVSVTYGANILSRDSYQYDGDIVIGLASYNAGLGSAGIWVEFANGDPDLYLEVIRFAETRNYIRGIYEQYEIYKNLYKSSNE